MSEMFPTNTVSVIGGDAQDGDTALSLLLYTQTPNNPSHLCVVDSLTWSYTNVDAVNPVTLTLNLTPYGSSYPQWQAKAVCPAGESITIDKNFVHGMPLWKGTATTRGTGTGEVRIDFSAKSGTPINGTGTGVYAGSIAAFIDGAEWNTGTPHGGGVLTCTYHIEPASCRRY